MGLEEILTRTNSLAKKVESYCNAADDAQAIMPLFESRLRIGVGRHFGNSVPYAGSIIILRDELKELLKVLATCVGQRDSPIDVLTERIEPAFIAIYDKYSTTDSISAFLENAYSDLREYSGIPWLIAPSIPQDSLLRLLLANLFTRNPLFRKDGMSRASQPIRDIVKRALDDFQQMYEFDVEGSMRCYSEILVGLWKLCEQRGSTLYSDSKQRFFPSLSRDAHAALRATPFEYSEIEFAAIERKFKMDEILNCYDGAKLVERMASGERWSDLVDDISAFFGWTPKEQVVLKRPIDEYRFIELVKNGGFVRVEYNKIEISDIIGQGDNVKRLGRLLYAHGEGKRIPLIVLLGGPGVGKTMSIKALAEIQENLRVIMVKSEEIQDIKPLLERLRNEPYRCAIYVDDMHFYERFNLEDFKTASSGVRNDTWPENVALVASTNPENWTKLIPDSLKSRFTVIDYGEILPPESTKLVFKSVCKINKIPFSQGIYKRFCELNPNYSGNGREIEKFVIEHEAVSATSFPAVLA